MASPIGIVEMELRTIPKAECHASPRKMSLACRKTSLRPRRAIKNITDIKYFHYFTTMNPVCDVRHKSSLLSVHISGFSLSLVQTAPSQTAGEAMSRRGRSQTEPNHKSSGSNLNRAQARRIAPAGDPAGASPAPAFPLKASGHWADEPDKGYLLLMT